MICSLNAHTTTHINFFRLTLKPPILLSLVFNFVKYIPCYVVLLRIYDINNKLKKSTKKKLLYLRRVVTYDKVYVYVKNIVYIN